MAYTIRNPRRSSMQNGAMHSLVGASTTASSTGTHIQFELGQGYNKFGLQVRTGTTGAHKVELEGSIIGASSDFQTIVGSTWAIGTQAQGAIVWVNSTAIPTVNYIRAAVTAVAKSSSDPAIQAYISAGV